MHICKISWSMGRPVESGRAVILIKTKKLYCLDATQAKLEQLHSIAHAYSKVKQVAYGEYGGLKYILVAKDHYLVQNLWVKEKRGQAFNLQARQWKAALAEALSNLKTQWIVLKQELVCQVMKSSFSGNEKHWLCYALKANPILYAILTNTPFKVPPKFEGKVDLAKCAKWLKRKLRKAKGSKPESKSCRSFAIDEGMYDARCDVKGQLWFAVASQKPFKRIRLHLTGAQETLKGNLRIVLVGRRVEIHQPIKVDVPGIVVESLTGKSTLGADKGFATMLDLSDGTQYGKIFGSGIKHKSELLTKQDKVRNKFRSQVKNIQDQDPAKAARIQKFNLGEVKRSRRKQVLLNDLTTYVNTELNQLFKDHSGLGQLVVEDLKWSSWTKKMSKKMRRWLSSWLKGYLDQRISFKCAQNGVLLHHVNAAYTSQTCPTCGWVEQSNRDGDKFYCQNCGEEGDANHVASLNILARLQDSCIGLRMPPSKVKSILLERFSRSGETVHPGLGISQERINREHV